MNRAGECNPLFCSSSTLTSPERVRNCASERTPTWKIRMTKEIRMSRPESAVDGMQSLGRTGNYWDFVIRISFGFRSRSAGSFVIRSGPSPAKHPLERPLGPPAAVSQKDLCGIGRTMRDFVVRDIGRKAGDQPRVGGVASEVLGQRAEENERQELLLVCHKLFRAFILRPPFCTHPLDIGCPCE